MPTFTEKIEVTAENLVEEVKRLVHEGNVEHVVIKNPEGHTYLEFPVTVGVIGVVLAPFLAAVAALVVFAAHFSLEVTRKTPV